MPRIAILVADGVHSQAAFEVLDTLSLTNSYTAQQYSQREVLPPTNDIKLVSTTGEPVRCGSGRMLTVDESLRSGPYDLIYVAPFTVGRPESLGARLKGLSAVSEWVAAAHAEGAVVAASGTAVGVLARAGLLDAMTVPVPWWLESAMTRLFPRLALDTERAVSVRDDILLAGRHVGTAALGVRIVARIMSPDVATWVERITGVDPFPDGPDAEAIFTTQVFKQDALVKRAAHWLQLRFAHKPQMAELADAMAVHPRTLTRRFRESLGMTPVEYLQRLRMEAAKGMLVRSDRRIDRIAYLVGYADPGFFKTVFRRHTGFTPAEFRRRGRSRTT